MVMADRKTLRLRAGRPQDLRFHAWLDFLAIAAERAPAVWKDLTETVWPAWKEQGEQTAESLLREWAERWNLTMPDGTPAQAPLECAKENLRLRKWREDNGQPQPPGEYIIPITGYSHLRSGNEVRMDMLPVPRVLQEVRFTAPWNVWRTAEPLEAARQRLIREFTAALDEHIAAYLRWAERAQYAVVAEPRKWRQHLEWFCDYQLGGREMADLLAQRPDTDESTLQKALRDMARALNLRLRPAPRGRPRK